MFKFSTLTALASAMLVTGEVTFKGPTLSYTVYGPNGGCSESDITYTGETTAVMAFEDQFEEDAICETDVIYGPNDTSTTIFTKFHRVQCTSELVEIELYNCDDGTCTNCTRTPELDAYVNNTAILAGVDDPGYCVEWFNATLDLDAAGNAGSIFSMVSAQRFSADTKQEASEAYWTFIMENACGDEWFENLVGSDAPVTGVGLLASVVSATIAAVVVMA